MSAKVPVILCNSGKYNPAGQRIYKESTSGQTTTKRRYIVAPIDRLPVILLELNPDDNDPNDDVIEKTYIYANDQVIAQHIDDYYNFCLYLHDRLGSVRQVIDTNGTVRNKYVYEPFGQMFASERQETVGNPFTFTGQYYDSEIGQYYLRARQYDPQLYRFTARDPVQGKFTEPLTLHKYLYCANDPLNRIDPDGRFFLDMWMRSKETVKIGAAKAAMYKLELGLVALNALRGGMINVWTGPESVSDKAKFLVGAAGGALEMAIGLKAGAAAGASAGSLFTSTVNEALSDKPFLSYGTAIRIGINTAIAAGIGGVADWVNPQTTIQAWEMFWVGVDKSLSTKVAWDIAYLFDPAWADYILH